MWIKLYAAISGVNDDGCPYHRCLTACKQASRQLEQLLHALVPVVGAAPAAS